MMNLEILRIELNYFKQVIEKELGKKDAIRLSDGVTALITCYLNPSTYNYISFSYIETVEQYLNQVQQKIGPDNYKLMLNNIQTIRIFLKKVKSEMPRF